MITVSSAADLAISRSSRTFLARFLVNGMEIPGHVRSLKIYKGSCGYSKYSPGSVFSSYIDCVLDECEMNLSGSELQLQIAVMVDGVPEWMDIGYYTIDGRPTVSRKRATFTALGRISSKMGGLYASSLSFPATINSVLNEISSKTGVRISATDFDLTLKIEKKPEGLMYREMLMYIAGMLMCFATESNDGKVVFLPYRKGSAEYIRTDGDKTTKEPTVTDNDAVITGIKVVVKDAVEGESEEISYSTDEYNVTVSNPYMTAQAFSRYSGAITGMAYRPAQVPITNGDPRIEAGDWLQVTDSLGNTFNVPCMYVIHSFDGGIETEVTAPEIEPDSDTTSYRGTMSQQVAQVIMDLLRVNNLLAKKITADRIDVTDLFAQYINATGTINGATITQGGRTGIEGNSGSYLGNDGFALGSALKYNEATGKLEINADVIQLGNDNVAIESNVIKTISLEYALSDTETDEPQSGWSHVVPEDPTGEKYLWQRITVIMGDNSRSVHSACIQGAQGKPGKDGKDGEDAVILTIDSSNGNLFKNNGVNTVLSVYIFKAGEQITTSERMYEVFGRGAQILWKYKGFGEDIWHEMLVTDDRLSDNGFKLLLTPDDVDVKMSFTCELNY